MDFLSSYPVRKYLKGELIVQQGDIPACAYVVKSGFTKVYNISANGDDRPVLFDTESEIFPIGWVFGKIERSHFYYEALTEVEVYLVPRDELVDYLQAHPDEAWQLLDRQVERLVNYQLRIHALEQPRAVDKILYTLEFLCQRFAGPAQKGWCVITLPLTQQDFANFVGLTRETTALELKKLQRAGIIDYKHQSYRVHSDKLHAILEEK